MPKEYKFKIENTMYEWESKFITGQQVRSVGPGIPDNMDLYLKVQGKPGRLVKNDESVDLSTPGIEKFYSQESSSTAGCTYGAAF
jgi:Multiubiquitin